MKRNMSDLYNWRVLVGEDTWIGEYDEKRPDGRGFAEIEGVVQSIDLIPTMGAAAEQTHSVVVPEGASPVFFRRRQLLVNMSEGTQELMQTVHCIGWKQGVKSAAYLFVFEDGSTLLTSDLQAV
jgi:hypothetical protein